MKSFDAETLIHARNSTVWEIITDGGNYTVWDSGINRIDGELRNGGTIRVRTRTCGKRTFRLRVRQIPAKEMTWTGGVPLGLFKGVRTLTLTPHGGMTHLHVGVEFSGPLLGRPRHFAPVETGPSLTGAAAIRASIPAESSIGRDRVHRSDAGRRSAPGLGAGAVDWHWLSAHR